MTLPNILFWREMLEESRRILPVALPLIGIILLIASSLAFFELSDELPRTELNSPLSLKAASSYLAAAVGCLSFSLLLSIRADWPYARTAACVTFPVLSFYAYSDTYQTTWTDDNVIFIDTIKVWSNTIVRRKLSHYKTNSEAIEKKFGAELFSEEGPMTSSSKPHGEWKWELGFDDKIDAIVAGRKFEKTMYYWYGEEVSEGEWHLRNKR